MRFDLIDTGTYKRENQSLLAFVLNLTVILTGNVHTRVHCDLATSASEPSPTMAMIFIQIVFAHAGIGTRVGETFIDRFLTIHSSPARVTSTCPYRGCHSDALSIETRIVHTWIQFRLTTIS